MTHKKNLQLEFDLWADENLPMEFESDLGYMDTPIGRAIYKVEQESRRLKAYPIFEAGYVAFLKKEHFWREIISKLILWIK